MRILLVLAFTGLWIAPGFAQVGDDEIYTLYRNSVLDASMRIHIATFDAHEGGEAYNAENCFLAQELFQLQSDVEVRFWCERGRYER